MHAEFPYIAFLAASLVLVPLPWHWRAGNVATLSMIVWLFAVNIIYGVDALIWSRNVEVVAPVWCDITTKLLIGANMALPAACLCVCMHLERVASIRQVCTTKSDKRRRQIVEAILCFGLPIIWMAIHYIVQGHRFDIIEEYGCRPATYVSVPAVFLIWVPPLALAATTCVFAILALRHFLRRRVSFATHLESRSGLTSTRYLRLMLLAVVEMILTVASTSVALWSATLVLRPWTNWADVHWHFSRIAIFPKAILPQQTLIYYYALWWFIPLSAFLFFAFFSFGEDAIREYGACFRWIRTHVFRQRLQEAPPKGVKSLPSRFVPVRPFSAMLPSSVSTPSFTSSPTSTCTDPQLNPKEANEFLVSIPISRDDTALAPAIPTYEISVFLDPLTLPVPPAPARTSHSYHIV